MKHLLVILLSFLGLVIVGLVLVSLTMNIDPREALEATNAVPVMSTENVVATPSPWRSCENLNTVTLSHNTDFPFGSPEYFDAQIICLDENQEELILVDSIKDRLPGLQEELTLTLTELAYSKNLNALFLGETFDSSDSGISAVYKYIVKQDRFEIANVSPDFPRWPYTEQKSPDGLRYAYARYDDWSEDSTSLGIIDLESDTLELLTELNFKESLAHPCRGIGLGTDISWLDNKTIQYGIYTDIDTIDCNNPPTVSEFRTVSAMKSPIFAGQVYEREDLGMKLSLPTSFNVYYIQEHQNKLEIYVDIPEVDLTNWAGSDDGQYNLYTVRWNQDINETASKYDLRSTGESYCLQNKLNEDPCISTYMGRNDETLFTGFAGGHDYPRSFDGRIEFNMQNLITIENEIPLEKDALFEIVESF